MEMFLITFLSCLLAGNFNGNSKDDNLKPDNTPAASTNELGDSWQVPDPRPEYVFFCFCFFTYSQISHICQKTEVHINKQSALFSCTNGGGQEDCDKNVEEEAKKPTSCGMITDPNGSTHKHTELIKHVGA